MTPQEDMANAIRDVKQHLPADEYKGLTEGISLVLVILRGMCDEIERQIKAAE